jgi:hypothetical protein
VRRPATRRLPLSPVWVLVAAWGAIDAMWCGVTGFRLTGAVGVSTIPVLLLSVSLICHATHCLRVLRDLGELFALGIVTALIATVAFCCAVLNAAPLADDALNAADLALGSTGRRGVGSWLPRNRSCTSPM